MRFTIHTFLLTTFCSTTNVQAQEISMVNGQSSMVNEQSICVYQHGEKYRMYLDGIDVININDSTLRIGLNAIYDVNDIDSVVFDDRFADGKTVGWVTKSPSLLLYLPMTDQSEFEPEYDVETFGDICRHMTFIQRFGNESKADTYLKSLNYFPNGSFTFTRRSLTGRHKVKIKTAKRDNTPVRRKQNANEIETDLSDLFSGLSLDDIRMTLFQWTNGGIGDESILPTAPMFGTYKDGHYEALFCNGRVSCEILFTFDSKKEYVLRSWLSLRYDVEDSLFVEPTDTQSYPNDSVVVNMLSSKSAQLQIIEDYTSSDSQSDGLPIEEVMTDLILFDMQWALPYYIDDETEYETE